MSASTIGHDRRVYDVSGSLPVVLVDGNSKGSLKFVLGPAGLAYVVDSAGAVAVYHTDGLGSVRALTDASGTVTQTHRTDAFGVPAGAEGSDPPQQPFGYTGAQHDYELQLVDLGPRSYFPAIGRFLQRDPLGGFNLWGKPGNVITWTAIVGDQDNVASIGAPPDAFYVEPNVGHVPIGTLPSYATGAGIVPTVRTFDLAGLQ